MLTTLPGALETLLHFLKLLLSTSKWFAGIDSTRANVLGAKLLDSHESTRYRLCTSSLGNPLQRVLQLTSPLKNLEKL